MFKVGDKVVVEGQEDKDSIIKEFHFTGDIVNNSWKYLVHMVSTTTGMTAEAYFFESMLTLA